MSNTLKIKVTALAFMPEGIKTLDFKEMPVGKAKLRLEEPKKQPQKNNMGLEKQVVKPDENITPNITPEEEIKSHVEDKLPGEDDLIF